MLALTGLGIAVGLAHPRCAVVFTIGFAYTELIEASLYLNHYWFVTLAGVLLVAAADRPVLVARRTPRSRRAVVAGAGRRRVDAACPDRRRLRVRRSRQDQHRLAGARPADAAVARRSQRACRSSARCWCCRASRWPPVGSACCSTRPSSAGCCGGARARSRTRWSWPSTSRPACCSASACSRG